MKNKIAPASEAKTGYALEVDGRIKKEGAQKGALELKSRFPKLQIKIFDVSAKTREPVEI